MVYAPGADVIRVSLNMTVNGVPDKANVFYMQAAAGPVTAAILDDLGAAVVAWVNADWDINNTTFVTVTSIGLRSMDAAIAPVLTYVTGLPISGTLSGTQLPANVSFAVKLSSGLSGRSTNGRMFWPNLLESEVTTNTLSSVRANAIVTAVDDLLLLVGALDTYGMVIYSTVSGGAPRATALVTPVASSGYSDLVVDTQRKRLR